ncbi:DUF4375 domain-containing protein [Paenibacillus athensensis]|uniref:DNA mimic protein DMP19 C-terminal domain-containing protein n=1 Tax=Paenibacillus athensensis TaxID=1967502 RepID=A0A4Y8PZR0_9BACL|nr:DUF4375 domain-containing protein [Paenibacillus athensensis]MCD1261361.1 DUF4375 domain-containing protein [Paenibacillus athensensis]
MEDTIWMPTWQKLVNKLDELGYDQLTENERIWVNIRDLIDSFNDGGLISYYYNHGADYLEDMMDNLKELGAANILELVVKLNQLFPNGVPPKDIDARNDIISSWEDESIDELLEELDSEFDELVGELEARLVPVIEQIITQ